MTEILVAFLGLMAALAGVAFAYWRGRVAGRGSQAMRYESFYEKLLDQPEQDQAIFFEPDGTKPLNSNQKVLLIWYFTIVQTAFHHAQSSLVDKRHAPVFLKTLSDKFGVFPELKAVLLNEGFDRDFVAALELDK